MIDLSLRLILSAFLALFQIPAAGGLSLLQLPMGGITSSAAAGTTFTLVQKVDSGVCATGVNTCSVTVSAIGSGHVGAMVWSTGNTFVASSISGGGTWTIPAGCQQSNPSTVGTSGCAYVLNTTSGATTVTVTWSGSPSSQPNHFTFYEYSWTGSTPALDAVGNGYNATCSCTASPGVALTLTGSSDVILQAEIDNTNPPTAISGGYSLDGTATFWGSASIANTASGTAPTWTLPQTASQIGTGAIAIK